MTDDLRPLDEPAEWAVTDRDSPTSTDDDLDPVPPLRLDSSPHATGPGRRAPAAGASPPSSP